MPVGRTVEGNPLPVGKVDLWLPEAWNEERTELSIPTEWLIRQACPEHPGAVYFGRDGKVYRSVGHRASWTREPLPSGGAAWKPTVEFVCPRGHVWKVVFWDFEG